MASFATIIVILRQHDDTERTRKFRDQSGLDREGWSLESDDEIDEARISSKYAGWN